MAKKRHAARIALEKVLREDEKRHKAGLIVCDFCHAPDADFGAVCPSFALKAYQDVLPQVSRGDWAMCMGCACLVYTQDRKALYRRVLHEITTKHPEIEGATLSEFVQATQDQFWQLFTGEIYDITDAHKKVLTKINIAFDQANRKVIDKLFGPFREAE